MQALRRGYRQSRRLTEARYSGCNAAPRRSNQLYTRGVEQIPDRMSELETNSFLLGLRPSSVRGPILARIPAPAPTTGQQFHASIVKVGQKSATRNAPATALCRAVTRRGRLVEGSVVDYIATILSLFLIASLIVWLTEKLLGKSIMHERWQWWIKEHLSLGDAYDCSNRPISSPDVPPG